MEESCVSCGYCEKDAVFKCSVCAKLLCADHTKLGAVCLPSGKKTTLPFAVHKVKTEEDKSCIREFVRRFWGEEEQLTFDREFAVWKLPAYIARVESEVAGFVSLAEVSDAVLVVALGVLPQYQGSGLGSGLVQRVEDETKKLGKRRVLVATSNDDLPALAFYQSHGFQIFEVKPNVIAEKHGTILKGIGGLPVRDELRLQKIIS